VPVQRISKQSLVLLFALAGVLLLPGATGAGSYVPPPGDYRPSWSPDGSKIAFVTTYPGAGVSVASVVSAAGTGQERLVEGDVHEAVLSPDWEWAAVTRFTGVGSRLIVVRLDGPEERDLAPTGAGATPAWSPDSRQIAFWDGARSLSVIAIDGTGLTWIAAGAFPDWSPDGTRIAYVGGSPENPDVYVVSAEGGDPALLAGGAGAQLEPKWSPDGTRVAFLTQDAVGTPFGLAVARADGTDVRSYLGPGVSNPDAFSWLPSGDAIVYARDYGQGLFRLDLTSGKAERLTAFGGHPAPSPDGRRIAFFGGGECRDRSGIYVARADGKRATRVTNDCRVIGTENDDRLVGTQLADVIVGLGGNDRLKARSPGYVGDTALGGEGDDILLGGYRGDILKGGRGDDHLIASLSGDWLYGGPGRDTIEAGGGRDEIYARDGRRDVIICGTNRNRASERDKVWADDHDDVAGDCEHVYRN
jgi:Tol biopolymer transport system component